MQRAVNVSDRAVQIIGEKETIAIFPQSPVPKVPTLFKFPVLSPCCHPFILEELYLVRWEHQ